jgi:hypothetical protein
MTMFSQLSENIDYCYLWENEIEEFAYHFSFLINDEELTKILTNYLEMRQKLRKREGTKIYRICKSLLKEHIDNKIQRNIVCE